MGAGGARERARRERERGLDCFYCKALTQGCIAAMQCMIAPHHCCCLLQCFNAVLYCSDAVHDCITAGMPRAPPPCCIAHYCSALLQCIIAAMQRVIASLQACPTRRPHPACTVSDLLCFIAVLCCSDAAHDWGAPTGASTASSQGTRKSGRVSE